MLPTDEPHDLVLDPAIRNWVLIPIMAIMLLIGVLRHHITQLMASPAKVDLKAVREAQALARARLLRANGKYLPYHAFDARRKHLVEAFEKGKYLAKKVAVGEDGAPPNPMGDPQQMDAMMANMKQSMAMMVPQMLIMGWINFFFSGFVLIKLPFPLTLRFKSMLQRGIETSQMDVTWVSSLSWYFLNLFGLKGIFALILGEGNAADGMRDMQAMAAPQQAAPGQPQDMNKLFLSEKESLELCAHQWDLVDVESRLARMYRTEGVLVDGGMKKNV